MINACKHFSNSQKTNNMKKITLSLIAFACSFAALAQNCAVVNYGFFTSTGGSTYSLTMGYTASGNKNFDVVVKCGATIVFTSCINVNGSGIVTVPGIICPGGIAALTATATGRTGSCNSASCSVTPIVPPEGGPLPVTFKSFTGKRTGSNVALNWQTNTEINTRAFILQRKTANGYEDIASIDADNISNGSKYNFTDNNLTKTITQYRLKIVNTNGAYSYSNVVAVKGSASVSDFTIFPNPSTGEAKITITDLTESTQVQLIDMSGRVIKNIPVSNNNNIQLSGLQKGLYIVRIMNASTGESITKKLTVTN
jgi:hypothetical protein